ncbi:hypothetical protein JCM30471_19190 [Desulfuromonas carbonis]|uniref:tol-pal system protein YbgF n=1 Tax=Desulfuromonas sp. DDH964 TaxID=1823759 RepID=UPI00078E2F44|nr:tol-pal system protein YbgF [Desulfuromonas sp. DDH964]AMV73503.1 lipoprotein [Desulfuromonas sp. DDH964]
MRVRLRHLCLALIALCGVVACAPAVAPQGSGIEPERVLRLEQAVADVDQRLQHAQDNLMLLEARLIDQQQILEEIRRNLAAEKPARTTTATEPLPGQTPPTSPAPVSRQQPAATDLYLQAFADYAGGRYQQAANGFTQFLDTYAASDYAGNAQYWLAECQLAQKNYEAAARAFELTAERYPQNAKAPDALLKLAETQRQLGQTEQAAATGRLLRSRFPNSNAARKSLSTP